MNSIRIHLNNIMTKNLIPWSHIEDPDFAQNTARQNRDLER